MSKPIEVLPYFEHFIEVFRENGDPERAQGQMWYMKHQFEFFGLKSPVWTGLAKEVFKEKGIPEGPQLIEFARLCYADDHREMQYLAIEAIERRIKKQPAEFIEVLEELILNKSWWDTVDWLAKLVGIHFEQHPELRLPATEKWMDSGEMWLQRVCLIFQLRYKEKTDFELMKQYILRIAHSKEFFLQKGAGWALRQYSRTNPNAVKEFVESNQLAALTKREGLRLIKSGKVG